MDVAFKQGAFRILSLAVQSRCIVSKLAHRSLFRATITGSTLLRLAELRQFRIDIYDPVEIDPLCLVLNLWKLELLCHTV